MDCGNPALKEGGPAVLLCNSRRSRCPPTVLPPPPLPSFPTSLPSFPTSLPSFPPPLYRHSRRLSTVIPHLSTVIPAASLPSFPPPPLPSFPPPPLPSFPPPTLPSFPPPLYRHWYVVIVGRTGGLAGRAWGLCRLSLGGSGNFSGGRRAGVRQPPRLQELTAPNG